MQLFVLVIFYLLTFTLCLYTNMLVYNIHITKPCVDIASHTSMNKHLNVCLRFSVLHLFSTRHVKFFVFFLGCSARVMREYCWSYRTGKQSQ